VLCLSIIIFFPIAEVYIYYTAPHVDLMGLTGRRVGKNPMSSWALLDAFCAYRGRPGTYLGNLKKTVNSFGFISTPELTVEKPDNTLRIVFLGGSSTAGTGGRVLHDEISWPWQAIEMLRAGLPDRTIEFINASLGGYSSFESYGRLWSRIRFFSPDIIIVYHGWNEMYYFSRTATMVSWRTLKNGEWTFERTTNPVVQYKPLAIDHIIHTSQLLSRIRLLFSQPLSGEVGLKKTAKEPASTFDRRGLEIWRTNLRLLRQTAELLGAKLFVAKQATLIVPGLSEQEQKRCNYHLHGFGHEAHVDAFQAIYRVIDEEISPEFILDTSVLSGQPENFYDAVHPTQSGAHRIASVVSQALTAYLKHQEDK